jgi:hypothetical protein
MDPVALWNLLCLAVFVLVVGAQALPELDEQPPRALEAWLIEARTHDMGLPGYVDPLYAPQESKPMELKEHDAAAQK